MNKYEILYILAANLDDQGREAQIEKYSNMVVANGGEVESVDKWGMKKFTYPINYKTEGYYVLMNFKSNAEFPAKIEGLMRISEEVVRCMVVRKEETKAAK